MNLIKNLFGAIGKIFGAIFGIFGAIGKKPSGEQIKGSGKGDFYLTEADAKGFTETKAAPKATAKTEKAQTAKTAATASALNLPQPTVTVSAAEATPEPVFNQFGPRRRPGANMKSFLDMAKATKVPVR